jgi:hypothetical protein
MTAEAAKFGVLWEDQAGQGYRSMRMTGFEDEQRPPVRARSTREVYETRRRLHCRRHVPKRSAREMAGRPGLKCTAIRVINL